MENKINIAELLKDCPKGMELDCTMFDDVTLLEVTDSRFPIKIAIGRHRYRYLTETGGYANDIIPESKCVIFPKGKTTWEGFIPPCKFRVGDMIKRKDHTDVCLVSEVRENHYLLDEKDIALPFCVQDNWELVPNKFDITTLKPFKSKVLVRDYDNRMWIPAFWGKRLEDNSNCSYLTTNGCYKYCIPYEGNEHLLGKTDDCDDFYKTWE